MSHYIYTLPAVGSTGGDPEPLRDQIEAGLIGTDTPIVPGATDEDKRWAYRRTVPTLVLYDEEGLRLYDRITEGSPEYYLFADELNLFKTHGRAIARAMGFPGSGNGAPEPNGAHEYPPERNWKPARWGDTEVGRWNQGVNGENGLASGWKRGWDVVELGAGALRKTAHFLTALSESLPPPPEDADTAPPPITYHALDLSRPELDRVLGQMGEAYGDALAGRVACVGLHGDYTAGLQLVRDGRLGTIASEAASMMTSTTPATPQTAATGSISGSSPPASPLSACIVTPAMEGVPLPVGDADDDLQPLTSSMGAMIDDDGHTSTNCADRAATAHTMQSEPTIKAAANDDAAQDQAHRPLHFIFLGSSLGNFDREAAAPFLASIPLRPGDTLLLGLDGRPVPGPEGKRKVERAYNDSQGNSRAFEEHGWEIVREELGLKRDFADVEFVGRYNEVLGRHESYYRVKEDQTLHLPNHNQDVKLNKGELLNVEWSYKFSLDEALDLFKEAGLNVVDSWKAPDSEYRLWLLERPSMTTVASPSAMIKSPAAAWPKSLPTWDDWKEMWKLWDHITCDMIPQALLHEKPIDLRHICLFYLGHIPTFLDIYISRLTDGQPTPPANFHKIFERGIDPDVDDPTQIHPHSEVPDCEADWPAMSDILVYRDAVRGRLRKLYDAFEAVSMPSRHTVRALFMAFEHEAMHAETLLYMLQQAPAARVPGPRPDWDQLAAGWANKAEKNHIVNVPATTVMLGHDDVEADDDTADDVTTHEFGWDNENPLHRVAVPAFSVDAHPVTNAEYLAFLTSKSGTGTAPAPASWRNVDGEWHVRTLYGPVPFAIAGAWPLKASRDELAAFAAAKRGRLPTEPELRALWTHHPQTEANTGFKHWHPIPPTLRGNGGVWEWTSTVFDGYKGFEPSEMYPGYSSDFFDGKHYVVLGGSYATVDQIATRKSFRNWYQTNYRYAWVGARVAYDA